MLLQYLIVALAESWLYKEEKNLINNSLLIKSSCLRERVNVRERVFEGEWGIEGDLNTFNKTVRKQRL